MGEDMGNFITSGYKVECGASNRTVSNISSNDQDMLKIRNVSIFNQCYKSECKVDNREVQYKLWKKYYSQDNEGDTLLHNAILCESPSIVEIIINIAPDPSYLNIENDKLETPLHIAVKSSQYHIARYLLIAGSLPSSRDVSGDSPLHIACRNGDLNCVKALLEPIQDQEKLYINPLYKINDNPKIDLEEWNLSGQTCIHIAAISGHIDIIRYLSQLGANINAREGLMGYTALHFAVEKSDEIMVKFLIRECPNLDLNVPSYGGETPSQICPITWQNIITDESGIVFNNILEKILDS